MKTIEVFDDKFVEKIVKYVKTKRKKPFAANREAVKILTEQGWTCSVVEQTIPYHFLKRDAFGFGDILAVSPSR